MKRKICFITSTRLLFQLKKVTEVTHVMNGALGNCMCCWARWLLILCFCFASAEERTDPKAIDWLVWRAHNLTHKQSIVASSESAIVLAQVVLPQNKGRILARAYTPPQHINCACECAHTGHNMNTEHILHRARERRCAIILWWPRCKGSAHISTRWIFAHTPNRT